MAKKTTDTTVATTKKEIKPKVAADPVATRNLVRLLNILALLLAITAFLLQFFAVITTSLEMAINKSFSNTFT